jgi:hypothetical protein
LSTPRQFQKNIGREIEVMFENSDKIEGELAKVDEEKIKIILPLWIWKSAFSSSCKYQLDNFYNKGKEEGELLTEEAFKLVSESVII